MDRKTLESRAANYPYLQGLWALSTGIMWILFGVVTLERPPSQPVIIVIGGVILVLVIYGEKAIVRHYQEHYGEVIPTRSRRRRYTVATSAWLVVCLAGVLHPFVEPDSRISVVAAAFAAATMVFYAILVGVRRHHLAIWGPILVAGLLPIWGGLGADKDSIVLMFLGPALIMTGVFDQRLLRREFAAVPVLDVEDLEGSDGGR